MPQQGRYGCMKCPLPMMCRGCHSHPVSGSKLRFTDIVGRNGKSICRSSVLEAERLFVWWQTYLTKMLIYRIDETSQIVLITRNARHYDLDGFLRRKTTVVIEITWGFDIGYHKFSRYYRAWSLFPRGQVRWHQDCCESFSLKSHVLHLGYLTLFLFHMFWLILTHSIRFNSFLFRQFSLLPPPRRCLLMRGTWDICWRDDRSSHSLVAESLYIPLLFFHQPYTSWVLPQIQRLQ